jgi:cation diffusion facilitator CzcD-associated flavoprotein CzcO
MLGTYEYSDFPMDTQTYGVKPGEHIPGHVVHRYLTNYAETFGIYNKIQFNTKVESAEHKESGGWVLTVSRDTADGNTQHSRISTSKLIVATGLTSEAFIPKFEGSEEFETPLFHSKQFLKYADSLDTTKSVCVFGGTKSAWDVVYQYATRGVKVDWVIRESGHGPTWSK